MTLEKRATWPSPIEWLTIHACGQAALTSALAPLFGNDPAEMALRGMVVGLVTGLPFYAAAMIRRRRR